MSQCHCKVICIFFARVCLVDSFDANVKYKVFASERVNIVDRKLFAIDSEDLDLTIHRLEFVTFLVATAIRFTRQLIEWE